MGLAVTAGQLSGNLTNFMLKHIFKCPLCLYSCILFSLLFLTQTYIKYVIVQNLINATGVSSIINWL